MTPLEWKKIQHFKPEEFACKCCECNGDGYFMDGDFIRKLDDLRQRMNMPMIITSGYRCPAYNSRISSTGENGPHTTGRAADIGISGDRAFHLLRQCTLGGWMSGIGINQKGPHNKRFIHLDDLNGPDHPRPRVWTY